MKLKNLSLILACLLTASPVMAMERTSAEMQAIAAGQLGRQAAARGQNSRVEPGSLSLLRTADTYCIYSSTAADGFVVVSRDDDFRPVLGYSAQTFVETLLPPALCWWLDCIDRSLSWRKRTGQQLPAVTFVPIENFVSTRWGQQRPYNNLCPKVLLSTTVTGCVATAMAQILKYYEYPSASTGSSYYQLGNDTETTYPVQLQTTFDWKNMLNAYPLVTTGSMTQRTAVAELMRDCGYAAKTAYSTSFSSAQYFNAANGLIDNFGFQKGSIVLADRDYFNDSEWVEMVYNELSAKRPILYSGVDATSGGHAFLLTGINNEGLVYVNWGWDGVADGFYDISDMAPAGIQGWGSSHVDHFNSEITMIYQITPTPAAAQLPVKLSQFVCYGGGYKLSRYYNQVVVGFDNNDVYLVNGHYLPFKGTIYLHLVNKATNAQRNYTVLATGKNGVDSTIESYYGYTFTQLIDVSQLPVGTYSVCLASKATGESDYVPVRSTGGMQQFTLVKTASGFTVTEETEVSAISHTTVGTAGKASTRYSLSGRRLPVARRGLNIVRRSDGSVVKEMVK